MFHSVVVAVIISGHFQTDTVEPIEPTLLSTWGKKGDKPGEFHFPIGVAIDAEEDFLAVHVVARARASGGELDLAQAQF